MSSTPVLCHRKHPCCDRRVCQPIGIETTLRFHVNSKQHAAHTSSAWLCTVPLLLTGHLRRESRTLCFHSSAQLTSNITWNSHFSPSERWTAATAHLNGDGQTAPALQHGFSVGAAESLGDSEKLSGFSTSSFAQRHSSTSQMKIHLCSSDDGASPRLIQRGVWLLSTLCQRGQNGFNKAFPL